MHTLEVNKIVGAVLMTALVVMVISFAGNILVPIGSHEPAEHAPATGEHAPAATATPAPKKEKEPPLGNVLASASLERGEKIAKTRCSACHDFTKGGPNKVGPNLYGVIGRPKGSHPGYSYSAGMKAKGGNWTYNDVYTFIRKPSAYVKGTKMTFHLSKPVDRASVILYLRTLTQNPPPLPKPQAAAPAKPAEAKKAEEMKKPEAAKTGAPQEAKKPEAAQSIAAILATGNAERGAKIAKSRCGACHDFTKGGPNKVGPNLHGIIGRARATHEGYSYSSAMKAKGGTWTYDDLFVYLKKPSAFVKGTKMTFNLPKPQDRADVIAYLRTITENAPPLPTK
jgi:cytochrome c